MELDEIVQDALLPEEQRSDNFLPIAKPAAAQMTVDARVIQMAVISASESSHG